MTTDTTVNNNSEEDDTRRTIFLVMLIGVVIILGVGAILLGSNLLQNNTVDTSKAGAGYQSDLPCNAVCGEVGGCIQGLDCLDTQGNVVTQGAGRCRSRATETSWLDTTCSDYTSGSDSGYQSDLACNEACGSVGGCRQGLNCVDATTFEIVSSTGIGVCRDPDCYSVQDCSCQATTESTSSVISISGGTGGSTSILVDALPSTDIRDNGIIIIIGIIVIVIGIGLKVELSRKFSK